MITRPSAAMVLGIDPGTRSSGWSLIDFSVPTAPVFYDHGNATRIDAVFAALTDRGLMQHVGLVAIEQARALWKQEANVHAMATAWAGGEWSGFAKARGFAVAPLGPTEWRHALIGHLDKGDDADGKVKAVLRQIVRHYPERSNVHQRDAAGVACVAARDWRRWVTVKPLPPDHQARAENNR